MTTSHWTIESHRVNVVLWGLLVSAATLLRLLLALHPGLWADEVFSLAMATGHSLEHPANAANPALATMLSLPIQLLPQYSVVTSSMTDYRPDQAGPFVP